MNFLTNILEETEPDIISRWSKKEKTKININTLKLINSYNLGHGFINSFKALVVSVKNIEKQEYKLGQNYWICCTPY
eukprot:gene7603-11926_t